MADVFASGLQAFQALVRIRVVAFHIDPDLRGAAVFGNMNRSHTYETDAGIGQFAFHQRFDLLAQSLTDPPAMIFQPALLHDRTPLR